MANASAAIACQHRCIAQQQKHSWDQAGHPVSLSVLLKGLLCFWELVIILQTTIASLDSRRPPTWTSTGSCGVLEQPNHDDQHSSCAGPCGWPAAVAGGGWLDLASLSTWQHQEHSWVLSRAPSSFSNTTPERSASCHGSTVAFWFLHMCSAWPASRRPPTGASTVVVVAPCLPEIQADAGHHNNCAGPCGCPYAVTSDGWLARSLDTWECKRAVQCNQCVPDSSRPRVRASTVSCGVLDKFTTRFV